MHNRKLLCLLVLLLALQLTACGNKKDKDETATKAVETEMPEDVVDMDEDASSIKAATDESTKTEEKNKKSGIRSETYSNYSYANYTGTITFYYDGQTLLYYKWYIEDENETVAQTTYENLCKHFTTMYGDGTVSDAASSGMYTTSWKTEERSVTVQNLKVDNSYEISFTVTE